MPKPSLTIPLSPMTGGVERREQRANEYQTVDAEDVFEDEVDLRRRDAFCSVATGPIYHLPADLVVVEEYLYGTGFTSHANRDPTINTTFGSTRRLLIGCEEVFHGIDWATEEANASLANGYRWLKPRLVTAWSPGATIGSHEGNFTDLPWHLDTTLFNEDGYAQTLQRRGHISWHASDVASWSLVSINSQSRYWMALDISAIPPDADNQPTRAIAAFLNTVTFYNPGIRVFKLAPVNGLFPVHGSGNANFLCMSSRKPRGQDQGTQVGSISSFRRQTQLEGVVEDEGSGALGEVAQPAWGTSVGGTGTARGSAGVMTKYDQSYSWLGASGEYPGQWAGAQLVTGLVASGGTTTTITTTTDYGTNRYEDCIVECTTAGGVADGERSRIVKHSYSGGVSTFTVFPAFTGAPTGTARFQIIGPPYYVEPIEPSVKTSGGHHRVRFDVCDNASHTLDLTGSYEYPDRDIEANSSLTSKSINFTLAKESRYEIPQVAGWTSIFDTITREHLFACGKYGLLRWDGRRLRRLAANSNPDSAMVQLWTGILRDTAYDGNAPDVTAGSFLRSSPPEGRFIADFGGRILVSGVYSDPNRVYWSAPGGANNLWPKIYEALIRANDNQPVVGMRTLGSEIVVWTPSQVFAASAPGEDGMFYFQPKSAGIGFANNAAVCSVAARGVTALIGANADGVYLYTGDGEPRVILDDYKALIAGGINKLALNKAVAAVSKYDTLYFLAVPSAGSSVNDKVLVFDYEDKKWWVWSAPFGGISSMAVELDSAGRERVYFGHEDGMISTLMNRETDDGDTITGRAKSPPVQPDTTTQAFTALMVTARETGTAESLTVKTFINQKPTAAQSWAGAFDAGSAVHGTGRYGTATWAGETWKTRKLNLPAATRGESIQFEIRGATRWAIRKIEALLKPVGQRSK